MPNRAARRAAERAKNIQATQAACSNPAEATTRVQEPTYAAAANASAPQPESKSESNRSQADLSTDTPVFAGRQNTGELRVSHGISRHNGFFQLIPGESKFGFEALKWALLEEHQPTTETEGILVNAMIESQWLANRAQNLTNSCFNHNGEVKDQKLLALYLRYQSMHTRAFYKSLNQLLSLRAEKRKSAVGFEAQKLKQAAETRAVETLAFKKEVFTWQKKVAQTKKTEAQTAPLPQTNAESSPQTQKMAA